MSLPRPLHALTAAALVAAAALGPAHLASAETGQELPSSDQLKSALLTVDDLGPAYTAASASASASPSPSGNPTPVTGCAALSTLIGTHATMPGSSNPHASTELDGAAGNPMVTQSLGAEDQAKLADDFKLLADAFKTCHTVTFSAGTNATATFTVTPITLGDRPDAPAVRLDGTIDGVQLNAYLGVERFGTVGMIYGFFQRQSSDTQTAAIQYRTAVAKVERLLGAPAGSTTPPRATVTRGRSA
ncbi:hypothetical protein [Streptomyces sp. FH025]|uniref:hypothetical protein n=1 Tax=Streptomyces sp. FH025 TaxID=2815937 RepID=UPI001A9FB389|nr:hypothetical protein [Streptomyces sp. FH025]MBO1415791.1 hypothetical protein [Streptomyces sp. FH025]